MLLGRRKVCHSLCKLLLLLHSWADKELLDHLLNRSLSEVLDLIRAGFETMKKQIVVVHVRRISLTFCCKWHLDIPRRIIVIEPDSLAESVI